MVDRGNLRIAMILLLASTVISLLVGIHAGFRQDWMRMSLFFFVTVLVIFFFTMSLMGLQIDTRFRRIEDIILEKSDSGRIVETTPLNQRVVHNLNQVISKAVGIFMVISVPVLILLAATAGLHEKWFGLGVYLLVCSISVVISIALLMELTIVRHSKRLEELLFGNTEENLIADH
ncbi:MAG TPA: hypothetical protein DIU00_19060 [Phycisphaerales bacterium]|nr:hypothetical protein [Phycisphaerales bacterium]